MPATFSVASAGPLSRGETVHGLSDNDRQLGVPQTQEAQYAETSITFGQRQVDLMVRLLEACHEASSDPETDPVLADTFELSEAFLRVIPPRVPLPDVMVHPDGEIAFEWHLARDRVLTVSAGPAGSVAFAALLGASTAYGRESFAGVIPDQVAHLLGRLFPTQTPRVLR